MFRNGTHVNLTRITAAETCLAPRRPGTIFRSYRAKDNTLVPVLFGASAVKDADGAIRHIVCTGRDISERMRAEEALRESEERYRDIVEYSQVMLYTHDLEGRTLSVNSFAAEQLGYNTAELLRMNIRDLIVPERRAEFDRYLAEIETERTSRGLILLQTAKGEKRLWEYNHTLRTEGVPRPNSDFYVPCSKTRWPEDGNEILTWKRLAHMLPTDVFY